MNYNQYSIKSNIIIHYTVMSFLSNKNNILTYHIAFESSTEDSIELKGQETSQNADDTELISVGKVLSFSYH